MIWCSLKRPAYLGLAVCILVLFGVPVRGASGEEIYVVQLSRPSLVQQVLDWERLGTPSEHRRMLKSARARQYLAQLKAGQQRFLQILDQSGLLRTAGRPQGTVEVLERRSYLINMLVVRASEKNAKGLTRFEEVRGVYENVEFQPHMDTAPGVVGAPAAWESLGGQETAGAGIKIGIIDSGIDQNHTMFRPTGLTAPPGFPRRRIDFTNAKVIVAENYVRTDLGYNEQDEQSPRPEFGHGTQVAGVAAGRPADSSLAHLSGIAPGAFLGNYKVFGEPGVNSSARLAGLLAAFNDAVADGMDVINMSLGGGIPPNPQNHPFSIAISDAVSIGIVVVLSAGNEGPDEETISWPGILPDVLTVGSVSNGRVFGRILQVTSAGMLPEGLSSILYLPGQGVEINQSIGPLALHSVLQADPTELACSPLPAGSLSGIVLVRRGDCLFVDKSANVFAAGAQAMVVYNNMGEAFGMAAPEGTSFSIPSVMISQTAGEALTKFLLDDSADATLLSQIMALPATADVISDFSSRGPNFQSEATGIKPDVVAIGENIHVSTIGSSPYVTSTQGTSFAAPMLTGGAALVLQKHPDWDARAVKSALVNTALRTPTLNGAPAGVLEKGNGRLDLSRALDAPAVLDPTGFSFGTLTDESLVGPAGAGTAFVKLLEIRNPGESPVEIQIETVPEKQVSGISLSVSASSLQLQPGQSDTVSLRLVLDSGGPGQGEFEGYLRIRDSISQKEVTASYWGLSAIGFDDSIILRVAQDGSEPFLNLTQALRQAGPGNVIEIADSAIYPGDLVIDGNGFRRRDGITLRAAQGESPVLEGDVEISNVPGLTLQGLTFAAGVSMTNSSGAVRDSVFEGASASLSLRTGAYHVYSNSFDADEGVGLLTQSASALVQFNKFGTEGRQSPSEAGAIRSSTSLLSVFDNTLLEARAAGAIDPGDEDVGAADFGSSAGILFKGNTVAGTRMGPAVSASASDLFMINNLIRDNQGAGISLANSSLAELQFGTLAANQGAGVDARGDSEVNAHAIRLQGNASGFQADDSTLTVSDSLVVDSFDGHGIEAVDGQLEAYNNTVTGNSGLGILVAGATGVIANSILFANSAGDLSPAAQPLASGEGNSTGTDPHFANPMAGDYSLGPDSSAIDAGSAAPISETDLEGHQRIAGLRVDQGALESGSEFAPGLILPVLSVDSAEFVGVAMTNAHRPAGSPTAGLLPDGAAQADATVEMRAYDADGELYDVFSTDLAPESQFSILLSQAFAALRPGWVEIASTRPDLLGFSLLGRPDGQGLDYLDGAALSNPQEGPLFLPEIRNAASEETRLYVVNPADSASDILVEWVQTDGSIQQQTRHLDAQGMFSATVRELFGEGTGGLIRLTSSTGRPFCALEIFGTDRSRGGLAALAVPSAADTLYGAQLAMGPEIETYIRLIPQFSAPLFFEAYRESGQLAATADLDGLAAGTAHRLRAKDLFPSIQGSFVGWLKVRADVGGMLGSLSFEDPQGNFLASLPLQGQGAREFVLSHVAENDQIFTGLTLLNPLPEPGVFSPTAAVSVEIFDGSGTQVGLALLTLGPGEKRARLLSELAPELGRQENGFVRVRSSLPIVGFELFGNNASTFLSAVPAQRLAR